MPEGSSVMLAAAEANRAVPKLCATDMLEAFGSCRVCVVEIEGQRGYPASCTTLVAPGMVVRTQSDRLAKHDCDERDRERGAMAMAGGSFHSTLLTVSWPTGEFSGMGIEGAVRLGSRRDLEAIDDPEERERLYQERVAAAYHRSRALNAAAHHEVDDVIDPAETRRRLVNALWPFTAPR